MVPEIINEKIQILLKKIGSSHEPIYVPVKPEPYAKINDCVIAVPKKVNKDGGRMVLGWKIWQGQLICEAEFHAVWESPVGNLIDINPKEVQTDRILFVQDDKVTYSGRQIDNIRINNTYNILVDDFIYICKALFKMRNKGAKANSYKIEFQGEEAILYNFLDTVKRELELFIHRGGNYDSYCFCGSNKSFNECHRKEINNALMRVN